MRKACPIKADLFVELFTGQVIASSLPVAIQLIVSARRLLRAFIKIRGTREPGPPTDPHHGYIQRQPGVWTRAA